MKQSFRYIIGLMSLAVLGIIGFQVYWLSTSYDIHQKRFQEDVVETLQKVIEKQLISKTRTAYFENDSVQIAMVIGDSSKWDTSIQLPPKKSKSNISMTVVSSERQRIKIEDKRLPIINIEEDSLIKGNFRVQTQRLFDNVLYTLLEHRWDIEQLDSLYNAALQLKNIETPYELVLSQKDSIIASTLQPPYTIEGWQTRRIHSLMLGDHVVQANFPNLSFYIFKQMGLVLLGSVLLLGLTIGCFAYMWRIILQQKKLSEIKNDFINNMTHELKTPISIISAANEALIHFDLLKDREKTLKYLQLSNNEVQRLTGMVEKILNISIYEKENFELELEQVELSKILDDVTNRYKIVPDKSVAVQLINDLETTHFQLDKTHFTNVLNNLMDNAIKYATSDVKIQVKAYETAKHLCIQIKDNGIGIAKGHLPHIFDKFYRVPTGDIHNIKGFGLGLSYVKKMVEKHGGTIEVNSTIGVGSTFIIQLEK